MANELEIVTQGASGKPRIFAYNTQRATPAAPLLGLYSVIGVSIEVGASTTSWAAHLPSFRPAAFGWYVWEKTGTVSGGECDISAGWVQTPLSTLTNGHATDGNWFTAGSVNGILPATDGLSGVLFFNDAASSTPTTKSLRRLGSDDLLNVNTSTVPNLINNPETNPDYVIGAKSYAGTAPWYRVRIGAAGAAEVMHITTYLIGFFTKHANATKIGQNPPATFD